ncbi:trans-aconitate 2-methyltransferase [Mangrovicella endophytica]|uniref:trans-aconitate 2-methyltransferase n=1 Tax=Mangrovicella endophytica TaxID=2066697 RepID=UPI000C9E0B49|nr:trans-aconitate 2-methyltransferase [Mangrovicella endophytica]
MKDWEPALYLRFEAERTRPSTDLLARVEPRTAGPVVDLGCGPGNSTELLARRFSRSSIIGVDTSEAMLTEARRRLPSAEFHRADVVSWMPDVPPSVIFANAVLQWVGDHETLLPRLAGLLAPGGVLAIQMPDNLDEPSHRLMRETAEDGPWRERLADVVTARQRLLPPERYYDLLATVASEVDVWTIVYHHPMPDIEAIVEWLRSTGLKPFIDGLEDAQRSAFLRAYAERLEGAYSVRSDGRRLLAFPRLFIVARL